jgi:transposase
MTYSIDFRRHVISYREKHGLTIAQTATHFSIGIATITRWLKRVEPQTKREGRMRKLSLQELAEDVKTHPDLYQDERAVKFNVSRKTIWRGLQDLGITYKKIAKPSQSLRRKTTRLSRKD